MKPGMLRYLRHMWLLQKDKPLNELYIDEPCGQNWQQMDAAGNGRHCLACNKIVVDFTALTDDEIIKHIKQAAGNEVCGRFRNDQLNRRLNETKPAQSSSIFKRIAASLLLMYAAFNKGNAQVQPPVKQASFARDNAPADASGKAVVIHARLLNYRGAPIANAPFEINNIDSEYVTDNSGRFTITLPNVAVGAVIIIGPTYANQNYLDATKQMIQPVKIKIDKLPFTADVVLYQMPLDNMPRVDTAQPTPVYKIMGRLRRL